MAKGKKTGGRKAGTPNKDTQSLADIARRLNIDPFEVLLRIAAEDWQSLGYAARSETKFSPQGIEFDEYLIPPALRAKAAAEACQYLYPKRKAIEQTVDPELAETIKRLENLTEADLKKIALGDE